MDVRMPDGTIVKNVPEGTSKATLLSMLGKAPPPAAPEPDPAEGMNALERGLVGAGSATRRAYLGVRSLIPGQEITKDEQDELDLFDKYKKNLGTAGVVGDVAANVAMSAIPGAAVTRGLRVASAGMPLVRGALLRGAGEVGAGAALSAATALPGERADAAKWGAAGSAGGLALTRLLGGATRPVAQAEARELSRRGVQPTIGQSVGGAANWVEEQAQSLPFIGGAIRGSRQRAVNEFNEAALRTAVPGSHGFGDQAIGNARDAISAQYRTALDAMPQHFNLEHAPIIQSAIEAADDAALGLSRGGRDRVLDYVERNLLQREGPLTPDIAKRVESDMGKVIARLAGSADGEERAVAAALRQVHGQWRQSLTDIASQNRSPAGAMLRDADQSYRAFDPIDRAASRAGAQGAEAGAGTYTPKMLRRSIEAADKSKANRATRYGNVNDPSRFGQLNRLTRSGEQVLSGRVADSGTAGRAMWGGLAGAAGAGAMGLPTLAAGAAGVVGSHALYSRAGQRFAMEGMRPAIDALVSRGMAPQAAAQMVEQYGPDAVLAMMRGTADSAAHARR